MLCIHYKGGAITWIAPTDTTQVTHYSVYLAAIGRGDDSVGNPNRGQTYQYEYELFEIIPVFNLDKQFPVEQFEPTVSQSTVPSPPPTVDFRNFIVFFWAETLAH